MNGNKDGLKADRLPTYACVETIDRSYFLRTNTPDPPPSCERIAIDRQKGRTRLKLDWTDRLRVAVTLAGSREIYSWTGAAPSPYSVEDILAGGPIGTGGFAAYLLDIFHSPGVQFRLLGERADATEYGFRVPVEGSHYFVAAGKDWGAAGYSGSVYVSPQGQIKRLALETDELPKETSLCQTSSALEFGSGAGAEWLPPAKTTVRNVLRDAGETESVTTISGCRQEAAKAPAPPTVTGRRRRPAFVSRWFSSGISTRRHRLPAMRSMRSSIRPNQRTRNCATFCRSGAPG